jgi:hypothetical protein
MINKLNTKRVNHYAKVKVKSIPSSYKERKNLKNIIRKTFIF